MSISIKKGAIVATVSLLLAGGMVAAQAHGHHGHGHGGGCLKLMDSQGHGKAVHCAKLKKGVVYTKTKHYKKNYHHMKDHMKGQPKKTDQKH